MSLFLEAFQTPYAVPDMSHLSLVSPRYSAIIPLDRSLLVAPSLLSIKSLRYDDQLVQELMGFLKSDLVPEPGRGGTEFLESP